MRTVFLALVLANLAFFAWTRYVSPPEPTADPAPLGRQIDPERLKVVSPKDLPAPQAATPPPPSAPLAPPASAAPSPAAAPQASSAPAARCIEWGSFALADAPRAEKSLEPLAPGVQLAHRRSEELAAWWVFIPPQGSRPAALRKAGELKDLGVEDYFIVQDDRDNRWALSLGVFRSEEAAAARLNALRARGVRSARLGRRETVVPKVWLQLSGVDAAMEARLREAVQRMEGSELRPCP